MAMTGQQTLLENVKRAYAAFSAGDMATLSELIVDDAVWHIGGTHQLAGDYKGRDAVFGFFGKLVELSGGTFKVDVHDILASDEHGVVLATEHATRGGKTWDSRAVHIAHPDSEGRIKEFWSFQEDSAAANEFWA